MPDDMTQPVTPEMGNRALLPEADLHATPTQQTVHLGLAKAADIHTTESNTLLGLEDQSSPALALFANLSLDGGRYDPSARYSPPSHGGCVPKPDYEQVVNIYERFRKDPAYNGMRKFHRRFESETGMTRSSIINKILDEQLDHNLYENVHSAEESRARFREFSKVRPFLSSGLDITTYSRNSRAVDRTACRPLEISKFFHIRSQPYNSAQSDSQSNAGSSVSSPNVRSAETRRAESASLAAEAALTADAVKEETTTPLHKLMDGSLLYESLIDPSENYRARLALIIEDKDSLGDGNAGSLNNSHKQAGTYLRTSHFTDGCAHGIVFHGTRFRPYQLIDCNTLAVWVPTEHIDELFPVEDGVRTNYTISWHESIEKFRNQESSMFAFDCGGLSTDSQEPQMLIKFICEIVYRISVMVSHQQDFPSDTKQIERVKNYNPYLDFTRFPPVDFSGLKSLQGRCIATQITITDVTLENVVPPALPKKVAMGLHTATMNSGSVVSRVDLWLQSLSGSETDATTSPQDESDD